MICEILAASAGVSLDGKNDVMPYDPHRLESMASSGKAIHGR